MRMLQCHHLCDESAHRPSENACMLETKCVDNTRSIISELSDVESLSVIGRAPDPAVVDKDHLVRRCEAIDERRIPIRAGRREAVQDEKRRAIPDAAIRNLCTVDLDRSK